MSLQYPRAIWRRPQAPPPQLLGCTTSPVGLPLPPGPDVGCECCLAVTAAVPAVGCHRRAIRTAQTRCMGLALLSLLCPLCFARWAGGSARGGAEKTRVAWLVGDFILFQLILAKAPLLKRNYELHLVLTQMSMPQSARLWKAAAAAMVEEKKAHGARQGQYI